MSKELEQTSEIIAEDNLPDSNLSDVHKISAHELLADSLNSEEKVWSTTEVRCFYTVDNRVFIAVLLGETRDSFLVGAAARLIMGPDRRIVSEPLGSESVMRWMKTGILYITQVQPRTRYYYYTFLMNSGKMYLPDYITDERLNEFKDFVEKNPFDTDSDKSVGKASEDDDAIKEVPGASSYAFKPLIGSEKIH